MTKAVNQWACYKGSVERVDFALDNVASSFVYSFSH